MIYIAICALIAFASGAMFVMGLTKWAMRIESPRWDFLLSAGFMTLAIMFAVRAAAAIGEGM